MNQLRNIHPGEVLMEEVLKPLDMTPYRLAKNLGVPQTRVSDIVAGRRAVTADTALRLAAYLGTTAQFWLNLQTAYDLEETQRELADKLALILPRSSEHGVAA